MSGAVRRSQIRFYSPENRITKISLPRRAADCADGVRAAVEADPLDLESLCRWLNRAALAIAMSGDLVESERSCVRQMGLIDALVRAGALPETERARIMQPWINIGRIRVIQGRWNEALRHFPRPEVFRAGVPVVLGPAVLSPAQTSEFVGSPLLPENFLESVHVVETAKAYARSGDDGLLGEHLDRWRRDGPGGVPHVREGRTALQVRAGQRPNTLDPHAVAAPRPEDVAVRIQAARGAALPDTEAHGVALAAELVALAEAHEPSVDLVCVLTAGAETSWELGHRKAAAVVLDAAASAAADLEDEVDRYLLARLRGRLGAPGSQEASERALAIARGSDYAVLRRSSGLPEPPPVRENPRLRVLVEAQEEAERELAPAPHTV